MFAVLLLLLLPDPAPSMQPVLELESAPHYQSNHWYEPFTLQISNWPSIKKWNVEYFATTFSERREGRIGTMPRRSSNARSSSYHRSSSSNLVNTVPYSQSIVDNHLILNFSAACRLILDSSNFDSLNYKLFVNGFDCV